MVSADRPDAKTGSAFGSDIALSIALPLATLSGSRRSLTRAPLTPALADSTSSRSETVFIATFFWTSVAFVTTPIASVVALSLSPRSASFLSSKMSSTLAVRPLPITPDA